MASFLKSRKKEKKKSKFFLKRTPTFLQTLQVCHQIRGHFFLCLLVSWDFIPAILTWCLLPSFDVPDSTCRQTYPTCMVRILLGETLIVRSIHCSPQKQTGCSVSSLKYFWGELKGYSYRLGSQLKEDNGYLLPC
jgi:hypothetical protein